jgi:hypothetical protein
MAQIHPSMPPMPNDMLASVKQMLMSVIMLNSSKGGTGQSESLNLVYSFVAMGIIEQLMKQLPILAQFLYVTYAVKLQQAVETNMQTMTDVALGKDVPAEKTASITYTLNVKNAATDDVQSHAILDLITHFKGTRSVMVIKGLYLLNDSTPILITDHIYVKLLNNTAQSMPSTGDKTEEVSQIFEFYSYVNTMDELRNFLAKTLSDYQIKIHNKLGNKLYHFNEMTPTAFMQPGTGTPDYSRMPATFVYSMQEFQTNRRFANLFGPEFDKIKSRVKFFIDNKKWYDEKGIPYTIGLLLSGEPGTGKTSIIKCLANETKRFIVTVHMHNNMTKTQFHNLFFNENLCVVQDGRTEMIRVPINRRIYVLEDIDCQGGDIVLDRALKKKMQEKADKDVKLQEQLMQPQPQIIPQQQMGQMGYQRFQQQPGNWPGQQPQQQQQQQHNPPPMPPADISQKLDLSYMLNTFDGILETPGRILIMTANYVDQLDKALIRPGRVDLISHLTLCTASTICDIVEHFFHGNASNDVFTAEQRQTIMSFEYCGMTPAEVTQVLFEHHSEFNTAFTTLVEAIRRKQPVIVEPAPNEVKNEVNNVDSATDAVLEGNKSPTNMSTTSSDWSVEE